MDIGDVRDPLDWASLDAYLRGELGVDGPMSVEQFRDGSANLTYLVAFGAERLVVRRPPFGTIAPGAHDMRRESTVLQGLWPVWPRVPRCRHFCADHDVIGADFLVMDFVDGVVVRDKGIPPGLARHDNVARRLGLALASAMGELHRVDVEAAGLGSLGRPEGFAARQVGGWWKRWQAVSPGGEVDEVMAAAHELLESGVPVAARTAVVHGDLKLNNCMFEPANPDQVLAVLDWDMATLGDPLFDVGTLLVLWPAEGPHGWASAAMVPELAGLGLPTRHEVLERYSATAGIDVAAIGWYLAFAAWKATVIVQQLFARHALGASTDERLARLGEQVPVLASVIEPSFDATNL